MIHHGVLGGGGVGRSETQVSVNVSNHCSLQRLTPPRPPMKKRDSVNGEAFSRKIIRHLCTQEVTA